MNRARSLAIRVSSSLLLALGFAVSFPSVAVSEPDVIYSQPNPNGYKVYLSRAYHTGQAGVRGECNNATERSMAGATGREIANGDFGSLLARGYQVRLGLGTFSENRARSNSWNSSVHLPLHSNAVDPEPGCGNNDAARWGTRQISRRGESPSFFLAKEIVAQIDSATPGAGDRRCYIERPCTELNCFEELCSIDAPRAVYSETEYHIWSRGITFLRNVELYGYRFGYSIDVVLGFPR